MSAYSEWKCGALSDNEFQQWGVSYNAQEKAHLEKLQSWGSVPQEECIGCKEDDCEGCPCYMGGPQP